MGAFVELLFYSIASIAMLGNSKTPIICLDIQAPAIYLES